MDNPVIGKYVYLDSDSALHVKYNCIRIHMMASGDSKKSGALTRIPKDSLREVHIVRTCSRCINDSIYDIFVEIVNKKKFEQYKRKKIKDASCYK
jgi:hypothetical protein